MRSGLLLISLLLFSQIQAQPTNAKADTGRQNYLAELKLIGRKFTNELYPNYAGIYSLPEKSFVAKMDSARTAFMAILDRYKTKLDTRYFLGQQTEIKYYFDKLLVEYPLNYGIYTGKIATVYSIIPQRLTANLADFNKPELLSNTDFANYVKAFLAYQTDLELKKPVYKNQDNKHLNAVWKLIPKFFSNTQCKDFWHYDFLFNHIDNNGIKNIERIYLNFRSACTDTAYLSKVHAIYAEDSIGRKDHLVKTYKTVGPFNLDMHMFLPDSIMTGKKRPVILFFHGGSWSEGKPDWFFYACSSYAKKGWIACAVEYRTYGRHGTLPFAAVMDARSAIRWIRQQANKYHIDTSKIAASGNSAGGHLVLCASLADRWNEKTDDLKFGPAPNILLVNAGVYDLTDRGTAWIRKDLRDKKLAEEISPVYLVSKNLPPTLMIHGTNDQNVPYASAKKFADGMIKTGNIHFEFQTLNGAGHFIWYDPKYSSEISKLRNAFLARHGY